MTCKLFADLERLKIKEAEKKSEEKLAFPLVSFFKKRILARKISLSEDILIFSEIKSLLFK